MASFARFEASQPQPLQAKKRILRKNAVHIGETARSLLRMTVVLVRDDVDWAIFTSAGHPSSSVTPSCDDYRLNQ
jgi:hypothetical protein